MEVKELLDAGAHFWASCESLEPQDGAVYLWGKKQYPYY